MDFPLGRGIENIDKAFRRSFVHEKLCEAEIALYFEAIHARQSLHITYEVEPHIFSLKRYGRDFGKGIIYTIMENFGYSHLRAEYWSAHEIP